MHVWSGLTLKRPNKKKTAAGPDLRATMLPRVVLVTSGMLLMFLIESLFWPRHGLAWKHINAARGPETAAAAATNFPWGAPIEYVPLALDRPDEFFTHEFDRQPVPAWAFRNQTEPQLIALFAALDFTDATRAWLSDRTHWQISPGVIHIKPPAEVVVSLNPDTRARLYSMLAHDRENYLQAVPFRFRPDGFDDWFAECGLPAEKVALVRKLTYEQGGNLCFADAATFAQMSTPEETKCLVKSLWRVSTFVMQLHVDQTTDVSAVMKYWALLGPAYSYKPFVESMSRVSEGSKINITYFLPPFARLRLYTYPNPHDPNLGREDCFWSSMNFFNNTPDTGFSNPDYTRKVLHDDYTRNPPGPRQFGDLVMLLGKDSEALHMCVYIADDVVFTKNGANTQQPWVLMKIPEMLGNYEAERPFDIVIYRRKLPTMSALNVSSASRPL